MSDTLVTLQDHVRALLGAEFRDRAESAATRAETARDQAVDAAASVTTGAPTGGWQRTTLHQDVQDSLSRADSAMQSMPRATGSAPGGVTLAGDLGGTADAPTVPGLAGKMDAMPVSDTATPSTLVKRTTGAAIKTAQPQADDDAATKKYVDDAVGAANTRISTLESTRATRTEMNARPAMWLWDGQGTFTAPAGAVVTDNVLNLATGEIYALRNA